MLTVLCHPTKQVEGAALWDVVYWNQADASNSSRPAPRGGAQAVFDGWYWEQPGDSTGTGVKLTLNGSLEGCTSLTQLLGRLLPEDQMPLSVLGLYHGLPSAAASAGCGSMLSSVSQLCIDMTASDFDEYAGGAADVDALLAQMPRLQLLQAFDVQDCEEGFAELPGLSRLKALELPGLHLSELPEGPYLAGESSSLGMTVAAMWMITPRAPHSLCVQSELGLLC
jgi:hypothetical protein